MFWRKAQCEAGSCVEVGANWRKSSRSAGNGACVEVAETPGTVLVRDSKDKDGPRLLFGAGPWMEFLAGVRSGEFER